MGDLTIAVLVTAALRPSDLVHEAAPGAPAARGPTPPEGPRRRWIGVLGWLRAVAGMPK